MRSTKKQDRPRISAPSWARVFKLSILMIAVVGVIYGAQQVELFLIRDPRFVLTAPAEYGEESPALHLEGLRYASRNQVLRLFQQDIGRSLYLFPMAERRKTLLRIAWIKEASITRTWPNQVTVRVVERQPAAFIQLRSESISRWSLIDQDGVILEPPSRTAFNLPVVSGVRPEESQSMRGVRVRRMLRMLDDLGPQQTQISEIDVSDLDDLKVTVKMDQRAVVLILGDHNFRTRFQNFLDHYQDIQKRISDMASLDLRLDDRITVLAGGRHD
jgi:cell division protein FtsQ